QLQALFQQAIVFVELTAEGGKTRRIGRFKMKLLWFVGQEIFSRSAGSRRAEKWVMDTAYGFISYRTLGSVALLTHAGSSDCRRSVTKMGAAGKKSIACAV